ncbi:MAG TPA: 6-carboxytetrahydropterin synthase [Sulfuricurvum sp.]|nr:6-carboxytetrahydropterin synthase [Sulfuricurvum sp.]
MKWIIDKQFDFCYGHRVWSQSLHVDYSLDNCLMCRHLHGHQGKIKIFLEAQRLENGMVTDFKHLNWFKQWLDSVLDHKFIIDRSDPLFFDMMSHYCTGEMMDETKFSSHEEGYWTPRLEVVENAIEAVREKYEGMVVVDFVPTSENLCAWMLEIVQQKMKPLGVRVHSVQFWETPKSHCEVQA